MSAGLVLGSTAAPSLLDAVYQHRLLTTRQVQVITGWHTRTVQMGLAELAAAGLVERRRPQTGPAEWWATAAGSRQAAGPVRSRHRMDAEKARGRLRAHTLAVNEVGCAFVAAARAGGTADVCPVEWVHEAGYQVSATGRGRRDGGWLTVDAVLRTALLTGADLSVVTRFVELDRCHQNVGTFERKLVAYTLAKKYEAPRGGWRSEFNQWPPLIVVLADKPERDLVNRRRWILNRVEGNEDLRRLKLSITTLPELAVCGPMAPIFWTAGRDDPVDLLGRG